MSLNPQVVMVEGGEFVEVTATIDDSTIKHQVGKGVSRNRDRALAYALEDLAAKLIAEANRHRCPADGVTPTNTERWPWGW